MGQKGDTVSARKGVPQNSHRPTMVRPNVSWQERASCGPEHAELMTAEIKPDAATIAALEHVCRQCPVTTECAAYGLSTNAVGFYGGVWISDRGPGRLRAIDRLKIRAGAA